MVFAGDAVQLICFVRRAFLLIEIFIAGDEYKLEGFGIVLVPREFAGSLRDDVSAEFGATGRLEGEELFRYGIEIVRKGKTCRIHPDSTGRREFPYSYRAIWILGSCPFWRASVSSLTIFQICARAWLISPSMLLEVSSRIAS